MHLQKHACACRVENSLERICILYLLAGIKLCMRGLLRLRLGHPPHHEAEGLFVIDDRKVDIVNDYVLAGGRICGSLR